MLPLAKGASCLPAFSKFVSEPVLLPHLIPVRGVQRFPVLALPARRLRRRLLDCQSVAQDGACDGCRKSHAQSASHWRGLSIIHLLAAVPIRRRHVPWKGSGRHDLRKEASGARPCLVCERGKRRCLRGISRRAAPRSHGGPRSARGRTYME